MLSALPWDSRRGPTEQREGFLILNPNFWKLLSRLRLLNGVFSKKHLLLRDIKALPGMISASWALPFTPSKDWIWLGASPDGFLSCFPENGILEENVLLNKGKPELALPCQLCRSTTCPKSRAKWRSWIENGWICTVGYLMGAQHSELVEDLIHGILHEFWWGRKCNSRSR